MRETKYYFENLDGLRTIAAVYVILFQCTHWINHSTQFHYSILLKIISFPGQSVRWGVGLFFILNGFLVTYLMIKEQKDNDSIDIPFIYFRRLFRSCTIPPNHYCWIFALSKMTLSSRGIRNNKTAIIISRYTSIELAGNAARKKSNNLF